MTDILSTVPGGVIGLFRAREKGYDACPMSRCQAAGPPAPYLRDGARLRYRFEHETGRDPHASLDL